MDRRHFIGSVAALAVTLGCSTSESPSPCTNTAPTTSDLTQRAYITSRDSSKVYVLDLKTMEMAGSFDDGCGGGRGIHMLETNADHTKAYVSQGPEILVYDTATSQQLSRIPLHTDASHMSLSTDGAMLAAVQEGTNSVVFIDPNADKVIKELPGFYTPHFVRFAPDGKYAYVANIRSHHLTRVSLSNLQIDGYIPLDGFEAPPKAVQIDHEGGFADAQIDKNGILYAAHADAGKVLVYDTKSQTKLKEIAVGVQPWIVYAQHPFTNVEAHVVPNFGDRSVSVLRALDTVSTYAVADRESFGVNYSSLVPDLAFVMNRFQQQIAVVNTKTGALDTKIDVGGTTETAATTPDGKYIVASVSSANRVVVIDAATRSIVKTFDNVGSYPWSVTIPKGQTYCH